MPEALSILRGYDGHRGYDWLVPSGTEAFPIFHETGTVTNIVPVSNPVGSYYFVEIVYKRNLAIQVADLIPVYVEVGDEVTRDTVTGLARKVDTHPELQSIYQKYGIDGMVHISLRESPYGGDKIQTPTEYGSPADFPCK